MASTLVYPQITQKTHVCLWFDNRALEAATFYTSIFSKSPHADPTDPAKASRVTSSSGPVVTFTLMGQQYSGLDGGPSQKHSHAASIFITCEDQAEIDYFWENLIKEGGRELQCGWVTDKFGISWQIVPRQLMAMMSDEDKVKAERVKAAMLASIKFNISRLKAAFEGPSE